MAMDKKEAQRQQKVDAKVCSRSRTTRARWRPLQCACCVRAGAGWVSA